MVSTLGASETTAFWAFLPLNPSERDDAPTTLHHIAKPKKERRQRRRYVPPTPLAPVVENRTTRHLLQLPNIVQCIREARHLPADCLGAISSFLLLCQCLDILQWTVHGKVEPTDLARAVKTHLDKYVEVYPDATFLPKGHMAMHLAGQLSHHGMLISCLFSSPTKDDTKSSSAMRTINRMPVLAVRRGSCGRWR